MAKAFDLMVEGYMDAAQWADDKAVSSEHAEKQVTKFVTTLIDALADSVMEKPAQAGHALYLSLARHGTGLWDDYNEPWKGSGNALHALALSMCESEE